MTRAISPSEVRHLLITRREMALLDVREEHAYAQSHPLFAASLPLSQVEVQVFDRVPRLSTTVIVYDDAGMGLAPRAAARLRELGYNDVRVLEGGLEGWEQEGYELFQDVNTPSKAFGELVEARRHTPSIPPEELHRQIEAGEDIVILDARRFDEYATMSIPTAVSVPGAELVLRAGSLAAAQTTRIVVNCAGRTRSIIGTQSLINAGYGGRVAALRNGTIGWTLAGLPLDEGAQRRFEPVSPEQIEESRRRAREVSYRAGVRRIDCAALAMLRDDTERTTYCFDVRTPEEYRAGHLAGFRSAPGGQLVQETDVWAPVRGACIVLHDVLGTRADMTASWLAQMGWDIYVLDDSAPFDALGDWEPRLPPLPPHETISPEALQQELASGGVEVVDISTSAVRSQGHIEESWYALRSELGDVLSELPTARPIVLCSADGTLAAFASSDVLRSTGAMPLVLQGGLAAWRARMLPVVSGLGRALSAPSDVYKRPYEGIGNGTAAMQAYLDWEYGLVDQLDRDATHGFFVI